MNLRLTWNFTLFYTLVFIYWIFLIKFKKLVIDLDIKSYNWKNKLKNEIGLKTLWYYRLL
jgi:hypothetical protein